MARVSDFQTDKSYLTDKTNTLVDWQGLNVRHIKTGAIFFTRCSRGR